LPRIRAEIAQIKEKRAEIGTEIDMPDQKEGKFGYM